MRLFCLTLILALAPLPVSAKRNPLLVGPLLFPTELPPKRTSGRSPASAATPGPTNEEVFEKLPIGARAMVQNSYGKWEEEAVTVVGHVEDRSVRVQLRDGSTPIVPFARLARTLSPVKDCGYSHEEKICKGDTVLYPLPSATIGIPEVKVLEIFENNLVLLRDGEEFVVAIEELGKAVGCSPQKTNICEKANVVAEGYRNGEKYTFDGVVEKTYTHGLVLIRSGHSLMQVNASSVRTQVVGGEGSGRSLASVPAAAPEKGFEEFLPLPEPKPTIKFEDVR